MCVWPDWPVVWKAKPAIFEAKGRTLKEQGWKMVMAQDASLSDAEEAEPDNAVPSLKPGCQATAVRGDVKTKKTKPASRFSEASLIREMEKRGIGRPATYAAIMETIVARSYVREEKSFLVPRRAVKNLWTPWSGHSASWIWILPSTWKSVWMTWPAVS